MRIKTNGPQLVNSSRSWLLPLAGLALLFGMPLGANGEEEPPAATKVPSPADILPDIQARDFPVKVIRRSQSAQTYLFEDTNDSKTRPGKILLLRRESSPVMAFRVVRTYPDQHQFAAKRVRQYGDIQALEAEEPYSALEKVGDVELPPPTAQDKADLKELEAPPIEGATPFLTDGPAPASAPGGEVPPADQAEPKIEPPAPAPEVQSFDPELDVATTPPPAGAVDSESAKLPPQEGDEEEESPEARFGATVDEVYSLDPNSQWLSGSFGYFRNTTPEGAGAYFAGGGIRYGLTLGKMLLLRRARIQDSLAAEAGVFYYKIINFQTKSDAYDVVPLIGTLRYNILFGENFGIFFYGGIVQNNVTRMSGGSDEAKSALSSIFPAAGGGVLFRVGPNWDARVDLGIDTVGLGLVLRF